MTARAAETVVGAAGLALYAAAVFLPIFFYPHFWTSRAMGDEVPWYFMGCAFIDGVAASLALLLCTVLGVTASRRFGRAVWNSLIPAFVFLSAPIGDGLAVLLHSRRIWEGPASATSHWRTFDEYLHGIGVASFAALAVAFVAVLGFLWLGRRWAAEQGAAPADARKEDGQ